MKNKQKTQAPQEKPYSKEEVTPQYIVSTYVVPEQRELIISDYYDSYGSNSTSTIRFDPYSTVRDDGHNTIGFKTKEKTKLVIHGGKHYDNISLDLGLDELKWLEEECVRQQAILSGGM